MLQFLKAPHLVQHFSYNIVMAFLMMLSVILLYLLKILLSTLSVIWYLICGNDLVWFDWSNNIGVVDVKMNGSVLKETSYFKMLGLTFSYKLYWGSYMISIDKTASKKIGAWIRSMTFPSPEVALISINLPYDI